MHFACQALLRRKTSFQSETDTENQSLISRCYKMVLPSIHYRSIYCFSEPGSLEGMASLVGAIGVDSAVPAFGPGVGTPVAEFVEAAAG